LRRNLLQPETPDLTASLKMVKDEANFVGMGGIDGVAKTSVIGIGCSDDVVPSLKKMKDLHVSPDASHPDVRFRRT
jgi:hypothetical protein